MPFNGVDQVDHLSKKIFELDPCFYVQELSTADAGTVVWSVGGSLASSRDVRPLGVAKRVKK